MMNYGKLAEHYGSFLVAIGGVSITVLGLVTTMWLFRKDESNRVGKLAPLVNSLIIATFCSFVGAQLMAETTASLADEPLQYAPIQFLVASTMIYISVVVCMFSIVLLARAYKKESLARGIRKMSLFVFWFVILCVGGWVLYSGLARIEPPTPLWSLMITTDLFICMLAHGLIRYVDNCGFEEEKRFEPGRQYLEVSLKMIVGTTVLLVGLFVVSLHEDGRFFRGVATAVFVLAIMFSMVRFAVSAHLLVGEPREGRPGSDARQASAA